MKRKKLIFKMAFAAILVFLIAGAANIFEVIYSNEEEARLLRRRDIKIAELTVEYQKYLDEIAKQISESAVNQNLTTRINSYVFNKRPGTKLYLWMNDGEGKFVFGVPSADFTRLNRIYDRNRTTIEKESYFIDRNDFLIKAMGRQDRIIYARPILEPRLAQLQVDLEAQLIKEFYYSRPHRDSSSIVLSSPIIGEERQVSGELYLKVDDSEVRQMLDYRNEVTDEVLFPIFHVLLAISAFFLWLLIPSWVYIDARQRDVKRAFMWAFLTVITFGFAVIVYVLARPAAVKSFLCPECEKELNGTKAFCPYCGFDLAKTFCPQCQYQVQAEWQFCPSCRFDLTRNPEIGENEHDKGEKIEKKKKGVEEK
jgi:hypothetical protein